MGKNKEGEIDPGYCKWCLEDGSFVYTEPDQMLDFLVASMPQNGLSEKECRAFYASHLKKLPYWKGKNDFRFQRIRKAALHPFQPILHLRIHRQFTASGRIRAAV